MSATAAHVRCNPVVFDYELDAAPPTIRERMEEIREVIDPCIRSPGKVRTPHRRVEASPEQRTQRLHERMQPPRRERIEPLARVLQSEMNIVWAMGYPTEIFEVTDDIVENWEKYAKIISQRFPFEQALEALELAATPGAADKVTVVFD